jgi:DNA-binding transcriptional MerR regulator
MFKIGEFSKLSQVPAKTLRYYDEIGLLKPAVVDRFTGYRYYSADQITRLNRLLVYKGLGFSLEQIAPLLDAPPAPAELRSILQKRQSELQKQIEQEQEQLARVEARLRQIEREGKSLLYEVVFKQVAAQRVASIRKVIPTYQQIGQLFGDLFAISGGIRPAGPPLAIYHDPDYREQNVDVEVAVPVFEPPVTADQAAVYELPVIQAACVVHQGSYESISSAYDNLLRWMQDHGYRSNGPCREVYLKGPGAGPPATYITEVMLPIEKA